MTVVRRALAGLVGTVASLASVVAVSSATGGPLTWAVTHGGSMVPTITPGTLTVLQQRPVYRVGDIVGYRNADLDDQVVLHRVLKVTDDGHLVMKGDANTWVDPFQPTLDRVLGEQVLAVPSVGNGLAALEGPLPVAVLGGGLTLLFLTRGGGGRRRTSAAARTRRPTARVVHTSAPLPAGVLAPPLALPAPRPAPEQARPTVAPRPARRSWDGPPRARAGGEWEPLVLPTSVRDGACLGLVGFLLLGTGSALLPTTASTTRADRPAQASVAFGYSAPAPRGVVYPDGEVRTGTPVFTRVVDDVAVTADLSLDLPPGAVSSGTWRLVVQLGDDTGWTTTAYVGKQVDLSERRRVVHLAPSALLALAVKASRATGLQPTARTITVKAVVEATASLGGTSVALRATPVLPFTLGPHVLRLVADTPLSGGADARLPAPPQSHEERLVLGPLRLPAGPVRLVAITGGAACLLLLALVGASVQWKDEAASVRRRHPGLLVPTGAVPLDGPVVEVGDLAALVRIASRYERFVLTHQDAAGEVFLVQDDGTSYRYVAPRRAVVPGQRRALDDSVQA